MKQYKKCGACRALEKNGLGTPYCSIGYSVSSGKKLYGIIVDAIPNEPCPKPLTVKDLVFCSQNFRR
jgi:hypothetical protein